MKYKTKTEQDILKWWNFYVKYYNYLAKCMHLDQK